MGGSLSLERTTASVCRIDSHRSATVIALRLSDDPMRWKCASYWVLAAGIRRKREYF